MISGIDLNETIDFVSQFDKGEPKTIFKISPVSSKIQARIGRLIGQEGEGTLESIAEAFRFGVKDIKNLSVKSVPVVFETKPVHIDSSVHQVVSDKIMDILPMKILSEIGSKIINISNLSDDEIKN